MGSHSVTHHLPFVSPPVAVPVEHNYAKKAGGRAYRASTSEASLFPLSLLSNDDPLPPPPVDLHPTGVKNVWKPETYAFLSSKQRGRPLVWDTYDSSGLTMEMTTTQRALFDRIQSILNDNRLSRVRLRKHPQEYLLIRTQMERSCEKLRRLFSEHAWKATLLEWVNIALLDHLHIDVLHTYVDLLRLIRMRVTPALFDESGLLHFASSERFRHSNELLQTITTPLFETNTNIRKQTTGVSASDGSMSGSGGGRGRGGANASDKGKRELLTAPMIGTTHPLTGYLDVPSEEVAIMQSGVNEYVFPRGSPVFILCPSPVGWSGVPQLLLFRMFGQAVIEVPNTLPRGPLSAHLHRADHSHERQVSHVYCDNVKFRLVAQTSDKLTKPEVDSAVHFNPPSRVRAYMGDSSKDSHIPVKRQRISSTDTAFESNVIVGGENDAHIQNHAHRTRHDLPNNHKSNPYVNHTHHHAYVSSRSQAHKDMSLNTHQERYMYWCAAAEAAAIEAKVKYPNAPIVMVGHMLSSRIASQVGSRVPPNQTRPLATAVIAMGFPPHIDNHHSHTHTHTPMSTPTPTPAPTPAQKTSGGESEVGEHGGCDGLFTLQASHGIPLSSTTGQHPSTHQPPHLDTNKRSKNNSKNSTLQSGKGVGSKSQTQTRFGSGVSANGMGPPPLKVWPVPRLVPTLQVYGEMAQSKPALDVHRLWKAGKSPINCKFVILQGVDDALCATSSARSVGRTQMVCNLEMCKIVGEFLKSALSSRSKANTTVRKTSKPREKAKHKNKSEKAIRVGTKVASTNTSVKENGDSSNPPAYVTISEEAGGPQACAAHSAIAYKPNNANADINATMCTVMSDSGDVETIQTAFQGERKSDDVSENLGEGESVQTRDATDNDSVAESSPEDSPSSVNKGSEKSSEKSSDKSSGKNSEKSSEKDSECVENSASESASESVNDSIGETAIDVRNDDVKEVQFDSEMDESCDGSVASSIVDDEDPPVQTTVSKAKASSVNTDVNLSDRTSSEHPTTNAVLDERNGPESPISIGTTATHTYFAYTSGDVKADGSEIRGSDVKLSGEVAPRASGWGVETEALFEDVEGLNDVGLTTTGLDVSGEDY
eukprot:CFRG4458T1